MALMVSIEGVNLLSEKKKKKFDMHCPLMHGDGKNKVFNFYIEKCQLRQRMPVNKKTCYPVCKVKDNQSYQTAKYHRTSVADMIKQGKFFYEKFTHRNVPIIAIAKTACTSKTTIRKYIKMYLADEERKKS